MTSRLTAELLLPAQTELGECPLWDPHGQALFWVDILLKTLHRLDWATGQSTSWTLPELGGGLALGEENELVVAVKNGIYRFSLRTGQFELLVDPEPHTVSNRLNEGKCDPDGRFWVGSMSTVDRSPAGGLYRVLPDGACKKIISDIVIPNCLVWERDGRGVFFADSYRGSIWRFDFDRDSGDLGQRTLFADCREHPGMPDGGALDTGGGLWNAQFGGGRVVRYRPDGQVDCIIELPATQVTSCCFAGPKLDHLVIVTTKRLLDEEKRRTQPHSGDIFVARPGVCGLPEPRFGRGARM